MTRTILPLAGIVLVLAGGRLVSATESGFMADVAPILVRRCAGCHGPIKAEGDYRLHTYQYLRLAGASGSAAIVPGKPDESELFKRLVDDDTTTRMPQEDEALSAREVALVRRWITAGAQFDGADPRGSFKSQLPPRLHPDPPGVYRLALPVQALAFQPDGRELAVAGRNEVTVWNPVSGVLIRRLQRLPERIMAMAYSRDGKHLLVGGGSPGDYGELLLVDPLGQRPHRLLATCEDSVLALALSHDSQTVVATAADRSVRTFRLADGKPLWRSQLHADFVTACGFSADDRWVATGGRDFTIKVLEAATGALYTTYNGHKLQFGEENGRHQVFCLAFAGDGARLFSAGEGKAIRAWEPAKARAENGSASDMEERFSKAGHTRYLYHNAPHGVYHLAVVGQQLFAACGDGLARQYDLGTLKLVRELKGHTGRVIAVDGHLGTGLVATGSFDGEVRLWEIATGKLVRAFQGGRITDQGR